MIVQREPHLPHVVRAAGPPRGLASRLHRGQEQRDQHANDGYDDQQFHQRETAASGPLPDLAGREASNHDDNLQNDNQR